MIGPSSSPNRSSLLRHCRELHCDQSVEVIATEVRRLAALQYGQSRCVRRGKLRIGCTYMVEVLPSRKVSRDEVETGELALHSEIAWIRAIVLLRKGSQVSS